MQKVNIFWFRRDLRVEDNPGLYYALKDGLPVLPVFIFDRNILDHLDDPHDARVTFIQQQVCLLDEAFRKLGGGMLTYHTTPLQAYEQLCDQYDIQSVFTNRDYEPYATERDSQVEKFLNGRGVNFYTFKDHVIFEKGEVLTDQGEPYKVFTPFKNKWMEALKRNKLERFDSEGLLDHVVKSNFRKPLALSEMGFGRTDVVIPDSAFDKNIINAYAQERDFPARKGTTRLGIHFRFGTVSIRDAVSVASEYSDTWLNELIWREFYITILAHYPRVVTESFKPKYDQIPWVNDEEHFKKWCEGKTGYPIVDAGMRELNETGYMHNRVRMVTASFLTKHLLIDWRWGESYFASKLLDFELASNNGGWQWAAGTGTDAQPYFRVFNPESQQKKFDPELKYIKKWVHEYGTDAYPKPVIEHKFARQRAIDTYKEALN